jgi:undecaprenyl-diphosphatase
MTPPKNQKKKTPKPKSVSKPKQAPKTGPASKPKPPSKPKPAAKSGAISKPRGTEKLPEQKLGDTAVAPWEMPTPEEKEQAKPVKQALKKAVAKVNSQKKADEVIKNLEEKAGDRKVEDVQKQQPKQAPPAAAAQKVAKAEKEAAPAKQTEKVLETTAKILTTEDKRQREVVSEAAQEVLNPGQQGAVLPPAEERQREYLRQAVLKRLKPLDALDANLFLKVNHLAHTRLLNSIFYGITLGFTGGAIWYALMGIAALKDKKDTYNIVRDVAVPLAVSGLIVEHPIKKYFKRRRPFISIIQAIVIGRKPGSWSFPSGHAATSFAGAYLLNKKWPRWSPLRYLVASSVAFSRIYLGDHYPGDVLSGSLIGLVFAVIFRRAARRLFRK